MKNKLIIVVSCIVFALSFFLIACEQDSNNDFAKGKHDSKYVGTWNAINVQYNAILLPSNNIFSTFSLVLDKNGNAKFEMDYKDNADSNESYDGKWRDTDSGFELDDPDNMQFEYNDEGYITFTLEDIKIIFAKEGEGNYTLKDVSELQK